MSALHEADGLSPTDKRHSHRAAFRVYTIGMHVVAWWAGIRVRLAYLPASLSERERTFDSFGRLNTRLQVQIAHQGALDMVSESDHLLYGLRVKG